jgi:hypothetical protein
MMTKHAPRLLVLLSLQTGFAVANPAASSKDPNPYDDVESSAAKPAESSEDKQARAKELFSEGRRLASEALYDQACPLFEQSLALESRPSTQFNLAECWEKLGKLASAQLLYASVAQAMHETGDTARETVARRRAELLTARLCGLTIETQEKPEVGLKIFLAGEPFDAARWGTVAPVDPGTYTVKATAPAKKPWSTEVEVEACPTLVSVTVPKLETEPSKVVAALPAPPAKKPERRQAPQHTFNGEQTSPFPLVPAIVAGAGAGALVFGTIFAAQYGSKNDDAKAVCPQGVGCSRAQVDLHAKLVDEAKTARTWAYVGFGVGGAALVTATVLYFTGDYGARGPSYGQWSVAPLSAGGLDTWGASLNADF